MKVLVKAYSWLINQRKNHSPNSDIWELRRHRLKRLPQIASQIKNGTYQLSPVRIIEIKGKQTSLWTSSDSLVLKAITLKLEKKLKPQISKSCTHLKGHGGAKFAIRECLKKMRDYKYVMKSDVKSYYSSIDHTILYNQFCELVREPYLRRIVWQYLKRTVEWGGTYKDIERGISLGCPLSPLMAALYLKTLDEVMDRMQEKLAVYYTRFMDDWVVMTDSRHKLRRVVKTVNQVLNKLKVEKHPDKTYIGRIKDNGFKFLGYILRPEVKEVKEIKVNEVKEGKRKHKRLEPAPDTLKRCQDKLIRLYERGGQKSAGNYLKRWVSWVKGGVPEMDFGPYDILRGKGQKAEHGGKKVGGGPSRTQGQGQRQRLKKPHVHACCLVTNDERCRNKKALEAHSRDLYVFSRIGVT